MSEAGFPRDTRLLQAQGFSAVFAYKKGVRGELFSLSFSPNNLGMARLGVVVAKRLARRAVMRNRIKRQAREAFRLQRGQLPALDMVLRLTKPLPACPWGDLRSRIRGEIESLLARLPR